MLGHTTYLLFLSGTSLRSLKQCFVFFKKYNIFVGFSQVLNHGADRNVALRIECSYLRDLINFRRFSILWILFSFGFPTYRSPGITKISNNKTFRNVPNKTLFFKKNFKISSVFMKVVLLILLS